MMRITICGSATFIDEMVKAQTYLQNKGFEIFVPDPAVTEEWYIEKHGRDEFLKMKPIWTKNHWEKIENSDAVLILNHRKKDIDGYFGSNTLMELSIAYYLGKKIYLLNPISEDHPHYEEIAKLGSEVLNGSLDGIKE